MSHRDDGSRTEADAAAFERHFADYDDDDDRPTENEIQCQLESQGEEWNDVSTPRCSLPFLAEVDNRQWGLHYRYHVCRADSELGKRPADGELIIAALCDLAAGHDGDCVPDADPNFVPMSIAYYEVAGRSRQRAAF